MQIVITGRLLEVALGARVEQGQVRHQGLRLAAYFLDVHL